MKKYLYFHTPWTDLLEIRSSSLLADSVICVKFLADRTS